MTREDLVASLKTLAAFNLYYQDTRDDATQDLASHALRLCTLYTITQELDVSNDKEMIVYIEKSS